MDALTDPFSWGPLKWIGIILWASSIFWAVFLIVEDVIHWWKRRRMHKLGITSYCKTHYQPWYGVSSEGFRYCRKHVRGEYDCQI